MSVYLSPHSLMIKSLLYISSTVGECWCWNWSKRNLLRMDVLPTPSAPITTNFARFSFQSISRAVSTDQQAKAVWSVFVWESPLIFSPPGLFFEFAPCFCCPESLTCFRNIGNIFYTLEILSKY